MKKALGWSVSVCALAAASFALAVPATAAADSAGEPAHQAGYQAFSGRLYGVAAISADDVWAVGLTGGGSLAVHWNRSTWSEYDDTSTGCYNGVAASSAGDVWAVGGTSWFSPSQTLAEHWNGKTWTLAATPNPPGGGVFAGAAATSGSNAWAVGIAGPGPGVPSPATPLIEHWNGKTWTVRKYQVPAQGGQFSSVAAASPDNAWVVGYTGPGNGIAGQQTLIEHWNGTTWKRVPSPDLPGSGGDLLSGVTVVSAGNAWAAGHGFAGGVSQTLTLHWNGVRWTLVPSPSPAVSPQLLGVAFSWTNNIWAAGYTSQCAPKCQTLIEHWNSIKRRWSVIPGPNPPGSDLNLLTGISAVSRTGIWAVGTTDFASTLIVHWNGRSWS